MEAVMKWFWQDPLRSKVCELIDDDSFTRDVSGWYADIADSEETIFRRGNHQIIIQARIVEQIRNMLVQDTLARNNFVWLQLRAQDTFPSEFEVEVVGWVDTRIRLGRLRSDDWALFLLRRFLLWLVILSSLMYSFVLYYTLLVWYDLV